MKWGKVKLGDYCEIASSKRVFYSDYVSSGVPFYRSKEIIQKHSHQDIDEPLYITQRKYDEILEKFGVPQPGDMLLTSVGTIGTPYVVKDTDYFYFKDGNLTWFRNFTDNLLSDFLYYWIQSHDGKGALNALTIGSSQKALTIASLKGLEIPLPPLPDQRRITDMLSAYDDLIVNNQKQIKLLEEAAMRLYKEWFVNLRFPSHENIPIIDGVPEGWSMHRFSEKVSIMSGGTPKTSVSSYYGGEIPFYTPKDCDGNFFAFDTITHITESGLKNCNSKLYPENTVIITARGTVGKIVLLAMPMAMNQSCYALKCDELNAPYYLFFALNEEVKKLKTMANGGVFDTIIVKTFDNIYFTMPNHETVDNFEKTVSPIMGLMKNKMKQIVLLSQARDKLLPKLMNGEFEV